MLHTRKACHTDRRASTSKEPNTHPQCPGATHFCWAVCAGPQGRKAPRVRRETRVPLAQWAPWDPRARMVCASPLTARRAVSVQVQFLMAANYILPAARVYVFSRLTFTPLCPTLLCSVLHSLTYNVVATLVKDTTMMSHWSIMMSVRHMHSCVCVCAHLTIVKPFYHCCRIKIPLTHTL
jgi:hypothetical protein